MTRNKIHGNTHEERVAMTILETSVTQAEASEKLDSKKAKEIRKRIANGDQVNTNTKAEEEKEAKEIFNPMYALFKTSPGDIVTYMIYEQSQTNPNHLDYFKFVERVIAKAIYDNKHLECYFTRSFYKHILAKQAADLMKGLFAIEELAAR